MHKFYWNNTHRGVGGGGSGGSVANNASAVTSSSSSASVASSSVSEARKISASESFEHQLNMDLTPVSVRHHHPEVPARAYGATSIKIGKIPVFQF